MSTLAFDTHQFVIDLTKADMPEAQAEALARHYANLLNDRLATKDDLAMLRAAMKKDISELRAELKDDITTLEHKMDGKFAAVRSEMTSEFAAIRSEMASEFNDVRGEIARLDQKMDHLEERLGAKIINTVLKTQFAGVVLTCTIMGLLFAILMG
jgi:predicted nuclease with TOPRIM domain